MLAKRYLNQGKETEEQFRERVKECVHLFQEAQASNWNPSFILGSSSPEIERVLTIRSQVA